MGVPSFFKAYRPNEFRYIPRYYNPRKEEREQRNKEIIAEVEAEKQGKSKLDIRGSMGNSYFYQKQRRVKRYTAIRMVVILIILFVVSYIIIYL